MSKTVKLTGETAIKYVESIGLDGGLRKYADPTEGERIGMFPDEAREVARQDPSLIYFIADTENPDHALVMDLLTR
jgi:hypothetical protein